MDGVGTPIIGRPRPLPGHDTPNPANNTYTLNYEEPHNHWHRIEKIDNKVIWWSIIMLFFASFFPYVTDFVSDHFTSLFAQMFYSVVVICVSLSNMALARAVARANGSTSALDYSNRKIVAADLIIKAIGIVLAIFVYPPINMFAVILAGCEVTFLPHIVNRNNKKPREIDAA